MAEKIFCISVRQPWALAIARYGKRIENREWSTKYRGVIFIHATLYRPRQDEIDYVSLLAGKKIKFEDLEFGKVIAIAKLTGVITESRSKWFAGPYGFVLEDIEEIHPITVRGKLRIFEAKI